MSEQDNVPEEVRTLIASGERGNLLLAFQALVKSRNIAGLTLLYDATRADQQRERWVIRVATAHQLAVRGNNVDPLTETLQLASTWRTEGDPWVTEDPLRFENVVAVAASAAKKAGSPALNAAIEEFKKTFASHLADNNLEWYFS